VVCERCSLCATRAKSTSPGRVVDLLLKTWLCISLKCHEIEDVNICWYFSVPSQDGWKPSPHGLKSPRRWPGVC
jgi:hypothetical protein